MAKKRGPGRPPGTKNKKGSRAGRPSIGVRAMTPAESMRKSRLKKKAKELGVANIEDLEEYCVFGPEQEAREFVDLLVKYDGRIVKAMRAWSSTLKHKTIDEVLEGGMRMLERKRIKELIQEKMKTMGVSADKVIGDIYAISQSETAQNKDKLRALELLGKFVKVFDNASGSGDVNTINLNISEDAATRLLERRNRSEVIVQDID